MSVIDDGVCVYITDHTIEIESLSKDVVTLLAWLCDKLEAAQTGMCTGHQTPHATVPLLLDGIHAVLSKVPLSLQDRPDFVQLIWWVMPQQYYPLF